MLKLERLSADLLLHDTVYQVFSFQTEEELNNVGVKLDCHEGQQKRSLSFMQTMRMPPPETEQLISPNRFALDIIAVHIPGNLVHVKAHSGKGDGSFKTRSKLAFVRIKR